MKYDNIMSNNNDNIGEVKTVAAPQMKRRGLTMEADREEIAMSLKTYRLRSGKTQQCLADEWGVSRYTLIRLEACKHVSWEIMYRVYNMLLRSLEREARGML